MKAMFTFTTFEIFLFGGRLVLSAAQWGTESERLKISVKNQKTIWLLLKLLEKWLTYKVTRFWMVFNSFWFCFTLSVAEKLKNSIFEIPIILQNLNINNWRATSAKSINLIIITKLIKHSFKNVGWSQCLLLSFWRYCCSKVGLCYQPPSGVKGARGLIKISNYKH